MSRDGSGNYSLPAGNPVVTGTTISSTTFNTTASDIATALTASIAKDGQTTPTANLPMGTYKHTGVGDATARTQYCSAGQAQDNTFDYLTSVSGTDTITATAAIGMTAYAAGQCFRFISAGANTGAVTINLNTIGAKSITKKGTTALQAGDIPASAAVEIIYDGTQFQLVNVALLADSDVTTAKIAANAVTYAKIQQISATSRVLGRKTAGAGDTEECSLSDVLDMIGSAAQGDVLYRGAATWSRLGIGTANQKLTVNSGATAPAWSLTPMATFNETQASGTNGGASVATTWTTRTLNTSVANSISGASIGSNQITLPAGTFHIRVTAPCYASNGHKARLQNITDASTTLLGTTEYANSTNLVQTNAIIDGVFTIAASKTFEIQHYVQTSKATNGFGNPLTGGVSEVYTVVTITQL